MASERANFNRLVFCSRLKPVYIGTILLNSLCLVLMALVKAKVVVIILSAISGIIYCTIVTIPYMLIAHYHVKKTVSCAFFHVGYPILEHWQKITLGRIDFLLFVSVSSRQKWQTTF